MLKSKAIKELFNIQDSRDKVKIIKEYDLQIKGFSNMTIDLLENNNKYISIQIISSPNIKKITNGIKSKIKKEQNLDYLLSKEKILEKYNNDFNGLLTIFENDKYGELTEELLNSLTLKAPQQFDNSNPEMKDTESKLRSIIQSLELKLKNKEQKINEMIKLNNELKSEITNIKNTNVRLNEMISTQNSKLITKEELLQSKIEELNQLKKDTEIKSTLSFQGKNIHNIVKNYKIHIIGAPNLWRVSNNKYVKFYNEENIDNFISEYTNDNNLAFYAVKFGITSYSFRKLKKQVNINFINSKDEFIKIIKEHSNEK